MSSRVTRLAAPLCLPLALAVPLFLQPRATSAPRTATPPVRALYEPERGAYLGAALDFSQANGKRDDFVRLMRDWQTQSGKGAAIFTQFIAFPDASGKFSDWNGAVAAFCDASTKQNATPLLTLEPFGTPTQFADDWKPGAPAFEATQVFAKAAGAWRGPLFVRFAHEMNGSWYPWAEWVDKNRNLKRDAGEETGMTPAKYVRAYRNVAQVFRKFAPNAALVWCPNGGLLGGPRRDVFTPFYPGDEFVDWVGLDVYERGWTMPKPDSHLWGGMLRLNLTTDMQDDPKTPGDESVNFYATFADGHAKPMMLCETSATTSYRFDLPETQRAKLSNAWRAGRWNAAEYGWLESVYGTTDYALNTGRELLSPINRDFPRLKAITWFHVAKRETMPAEKSPGNVVWFENGWCDYRIGASAEENRTSPYAAREWKLYRDLTRNDYFLSHVVK